MISKSLCYLAVFLVMAVMAKPKAPPAVASKEDLKYIGCEVCEKMVLAMKEGLDKLKPYPPKKILMEIQVLDVVEDICNPQNATGQWIKKLDIVESSNLGLTYLKLEEPGGISKCGSECLTIAKSCQNMFDNEVEIDDMTAMLRKKTKFSARDLQVGCLCLKCNAAFIDNVST